MSQHTDKMELMLAQIRRRGVMYPSPNSSVRICQSDCGTGFDVTATVDGKREIVATVPTLDDAQHKAVIAGMEIWSRRSQNFF